MEIEFGSQRRLLNKDSIFIISKKSKVLILHPEPWPCFLKRNVNFLVSPRTRNFCRKSTLKMCWSHLGLFKPSTMCCVYTLYGHGKTYTVVCIRGINDTWEQHNLQSSVKWGPEAVLIMGAMPSTRGAALVATTENISIFTGTCNTG